MNKVKPQPNPSSLLTDKQVVKIIEDVAQRIGFESFLPTVDMRLLTPVLETQRDLTASIKDTGWIKALLKEGICVTKPEDLKGIRKRLDETHEARIEALKEVQKHVDERDISDEDGSCPPSP